MSAHRAMCAAVDLVAGLGDEDLVDDVNAAHAATADRRAAALRAVGAA